MLIEVKDLSVTFSAAHSVQAVQGVSLSMEQGQKTAIIGETGSGKSVLLLAMLRLLPPSARVGGSVLFDGRELLLLKEKEMESIRGAQVAYVPQGSGGSLNPLLRVGFQVGEPLMRHGGLRKKQAVEESVRLLARFQIGSEEQRARSYPHTFSGGMKQRALVAMGISAGARVILADEPTKGLDEGKVAQVREVFLSLGEQTLLCVTHDLNFAGAVAQDIHVMYASQQVECAPTAELLGNPLHPYTRDMIRAMPENGLEASRGFAPPHSENVSGCRYRSRCRDCTALCENAPPMAEVTKQHRVRCWRYWV